MAVVLGMAALISVQSLKAGNFGVVGGASFYGIKDVSAGSTLGYHAGLTYKFHLPLGFSIQPSVLYHMKSAISDGGTFDVDMNVGYVEVPVSFQWGPDLLLFRPFIDVSPFVGYGIYQDFEGKKWDEIASTIVKDSWNSVNRMEYGLGLGAGLEVWKFQLICRYNWNFGTLVNKDGKADIFPALKQGIGDNNFGGVTLSLALLF